MLTRFWMSSGRRQRVPTVCKVSSFDSYEAQRKLMAMERIPNHTLARWWYWFWYGYAFDLKDSRRVSRPHDVYILRGTESEGI